MPDEHDDDLLDELRDLTDARGATDYDLEESQRGLEERFLDGDDEQLGAPMPYRPEVPKAQPCNKATMVCLRGPCRYLWSMTTRYGLDDGKTVRIQRHRVCVRHNYETQLADQNVYVCEAWWPAPLSWLPESVWVPMSRPVRALYEKWLALRGYNFDWRWFSLDSFEWDSKDRRGFSGPGGGHLYDAAQAAKKSKTGFGADAPAEEDDDA